jgi:hypothetical protein
MMCCLSILVLSAIIIVAPSQDDGHTVYSEGGAASGAIEVDGGGGDGEGEDVDGGAIFGDEAAVALDGCGFNVTGMPHILDSVVLTGLSFDAGLLGLHIASFCSGVNEEAFT